MKGGRFARIPIWAVSAKLSPQAWQALTAICAHVDPAGWAWPSLDRIAAMTGMARKNVPRIITELEDAGLLRRSRGTGGRGNSTRYQVVFNGPETSSKTSPKRPQPLRTEQKEEQTQRACVCESFMKFRGTYPSRGDYGDPETPARREFEAAVLDRGVDPEEIIAGAARYAAQMARAGTQPRFIKMSANWLEDEGWKDRVRAPERRRPVAGMA